MTSSGTPHSPGPPGTPRPAGAGGGFLELDDPLRGRLAVRSGETVVLLGPSGAGKTMIIRALLGLEGTGLPAVLSLRGERVPATRLAAEVGWVPEGDGVFLSDSVWDNVARPPSAAPNDPARARDALELVGLAGRAAEPVANLPRQGRRRVALARALASQRPLLLVDGELDPTLWALLPAVMAQSAGVEAALLATARAGDRAWAADSVALVAGGRVVAQGPLGDLFHSRDPDVRSVLAWVAPPE